MSGALSPGLKAVGREEYLQTWIDARSNNADASGTILHAETRDEGGVATQLYTACLDVLKDLYKIVANGRRNESRPRYGTASLLLTPPESNVSKDFFLSDDEETTNTIEKPKKGQKRVLKGATTDLVKYSNGRIGTASRIYNIRADADDEVSNAIHSDLLESSTRNRPSGTTVRPQSSGQRCMKDALGKLFLWGEDLIDGGLDRALGESGELRDHVLESLCGIAEILRYKLLPLVAVQPLQGAFRRRLQDLDSLMEQSTLIISRDGTQTSKLSGDIEEVYFSDSDESYEDEDSDGEVSSVKPHYDPVLDIGKQLKFRTEDLMDLLPTLEHNISLVESVHRNSSTATVTSFKISTPAHAYLSVLRDKYSNADEDLIERLGEANWQRHVIVRGKMEQIADSPTHEPTKILEGNATIFHDSGTGTTISGPSQYAKSAASHTSFISSLAEGEKGTMRVPSTPKEITAGESFCCNFCGILQSGLRNRVDWKMHVFADIRPYICTFPSCTDLLTAFPTRQLWAEHEFSKHRFDVSWVCPECQGEYYSTKALEHHLAKSHGRIFTRSKFLMLVNTAHRTRQKPIKDQKCPLCMAAPGTTRRAFVSHIARHMEEIALLALPCETEDDSGVKSGDALTAASGYGLGDVSEDGAGDEARDDTGDDSRDALTIAPGYYLGDVLEDGAGDEARDDTGDDSRDALTAAPGHYFTAAPGHYFTAAPGHYLTAAPGYYLTAASGYGLGHVLEDGAGDEARDYTGYYALPAATGYYGVSLRAAAKFVLRDVLDKPSTSPRLDYGSEEFLFPPLGEMVPKVPALNDKSKKSPSLFSSLAELEPEVPAILPLALTEAASTVVGPPNSSTDPPPLHSCALCTRKYRRRIDLLRHTKEHSAPSFPCPVEGCSFAGTKRFMRRDFLKLHIEKRHPEYSPNTMSGRETNQRNETQGRLCEEREGFERA